MTAVSDHDDDEVMLRKRAKAALRKQLKGLGATYPLELLRERSEAIVRRLSATALFERASSVVMFLAGPSSREVDLGKLAAMAREQGKQVALLRVDFDEQRVEFRALEQGARLEARGLWFMEAPEGAPIVEPGAIDLVIAPVLAADPCGSFIGDGSGLVDRALEMAAGAVSVAVAFQFQIIPESPVTAGDESVHWVVTDAGVYEARASVADAELAARDGLVRASKEDRRVGVLHPDSGPDPGPGHRASNRMGRIPQTSSGAAGGRKPQEG